MIRALAQNPTDGINLSYEVDGPTTAPTVLLLHGSCLSAASWRGLGYVRALREVYRVVALDLRGHGRSDKPHTPEGYGTDRFLGDIQALREAIGGGTLNIVGYSVGARLGLELAAQQPESVGSLTLLGGTSAPLRGQVGTVFFPGYREALLGGGMPAFIEGWEARRGVPLDASTRAVFLRNDPLALAAYFARSEDEVGVPDAVLTRIHTPTLWLAGSEDHPRLEQSRRAARVMGAECITLPGRTHSSTLFPAEPVLDSIRPFLARAIVAEPALPYRAATPRTSPSSTDTHSA
ncbi:alpha/beta hydrolase [Klugiella xanthotipulae]|uniref:Pimeloyl-ACP methyl ester carboxylesterase n=1 Tax=Klugiella xanthotipulae TaxID=244735 RepID=A0A543HT38_9MICO|nr:alpha/beta hydrolase [Klugiella xanthotipulae]TQM61527.1 pimeloyl-ACP methyl ester carboxylesterase [Klugiella xanthotipulae]